MTDPTTDAAREAVCVSCGQPAHETNCYQDADGSYQLARFERFAVCHRCIPCSEETLLNNTAEMEPEEAALRCWYHRIRHAGESFEEVAETVMNRTAQNAAAVSRARDEYHAERLREAVEGLRWTRDVEDEDHDAMCAIMGGGQCESCINVDAHNAALDALTARMDGAK